MRFSEAATVSSMMMLVSWARNCMKRRISPSASRGSWPERITSVTAIAPALMKGLRGTPRSRSSCTMELNGLPEGSRPTRFQRRSPTMPRARVSVNTFDTLWIENGRLAVAAGEDLSLGVDHRHAELVGIDPGELGDVVRDRAPVGALGHLLGDLPDDVGKVGHGRARASAVGTGPVRDVSGDARSGPARR